MRASLHETLSVTSFRVIATAQCPSQSRCSARSLIAAWSVDPHPAPRPGAGPSSPPDRLGAGRRGLRPACPAFSARDRVKGALRRAAPALDPPACALSLMCRS